jgi:ABC-type nickel/cobalt efflux system permease component RcnA
MRRAILTAALVLAAVLALAWAFGAVDALARWAAEGQRAAQNAMAGALRRLHAGEAGALAALLGVAFTYGFLHAVGPGHGKMLIGGYGAASRVRLAPLAAIAAASSAMQATVAVALVYGGAFALGWGRVQVEGAADDWLAPAGLIAMLAIGLWLLVRGVRGLGLRLTPASPTLALAGGGQTRDYAEFHDHRHGHETDHGHGPAAACDTCGHRHGPAPEDIARLSGWRDAVLLVGAIGLRPCTGALFLLILTWRMGLTWAGIAGAYAMAMGTALVTVAVAALSVSARDGAHLWAGRLALLRVLAPAAELVVGALVVAVSAQLLMQAL